MDRRLWCQINPPSPPIDPERIDFDTSIVSKDDLRKWAAGSAIYGTIPVACMLTATFNIVITCFIRSYCDTKTRPEYPINRVGDRMWFASNEYAASITVDDRLTLPSSQVLLRFLMPFSDVKAILATDNPPDFILCGVEFWPNDKRVDYINKCRSGFTYDGLFYHNGTVARK